MGSVSLEMFERILRLNGTTIMVNVTELPPLVDIGNASAFFAGVANVSKVVCVFANRTKIDSDLETKIATAVSGCILPIGGWSYIDYLYTDELLESYATRLASKLYSDYLYIGYVGISYDSYEGWFGNVTLTSGVPSSLHWMYNHQYWTIYIELTMVAG